VTINLDMIIDANPHFLPLREGVSLCRDSRQAGPMSRASCVIPSFFLKAAIEVNQQFHITALASGQPKKVWFRSLWNPAFDDLHADLGF
jgi:hypothetical protein